MASNNNGVDVELSDLSKEGRAAAAKEDFLQRRPSIDQAILDEGIDESTLPAPDLIHDLRDIYINEDPKMPKKDYEKVTRYWDGNAVSTAKYTWWNFIFLNLLQQFRRLANIYFLGITILSCIPVISPLNPATSVLPLLFVLGVTAVKDAAEDWGRRKADSIMNNSPTRKVHNGVVVPILWKNVTVGDILEVHEDEAFPADMIVLASEVTTDPMEEKRNESAMCFIETANLDGETNLKIRQGHPETSSLRSMEALSSVKIHVRCQGPTAKMDEYQGLLNLHKPMKTYKCAIGGNQVLLRGCTLKNTVRAWGITTHCGRDSKIMMNASQNPPAKLGDVVFVEVSGVNMWYLQLASQTAFNPANPAAVIVLGFFTFIILYNTLIPISLYVTIEVIRLLIGFWIDWDLDMYYAPNDKPAACRNSSLCEELGQVQFILSDKTGTLTQNKMALLKVCVGGESYGTGITEIEATQARLERKTLEVPFRPPKPDHYDELFEFYDSRLNDYTWIIRDRGIASAADIQREAEIRDFLRCVAICHTVIPELLSSGEIKYNAASPDDGALVCAAKNLGFEFRSRKQLPGGVEAIVVCEPSYDPSSDSIVHTDCVYNVLDIVDFTSKRKRMSIVVRGPDSNIRVYTKGADNIIIERLTDSNLASPVANHSRELLDIFARQGLRTLALAYCDVPDDVYRAWHRRYTDALQSLSADRDEKIDKIGEEIEKNFILLGATAIEDKLQEDVASTISHLAEAGIQLWVLTGDKMGTAIMIGFACSLLTEDMHRVEIRAEMHPSYIAEVLEEAVAKFGDMAEDQRPKLCMIVEGKALECIGIGLNRADFYALDKHRQAELLTWQQSFIKFGSMCQAVVCCRVSPKQKADVTLLVRKQLRRVTLGIGDGANDVGMIQAAHIGVGIIGVEGAAAVNNSDFALPQFKHLEKLILVHGRWTYNRVAKTVCYFFYKNIAFTLCMLWFGIFNGVSGQPLYDNWLQAFYNTLFTALPVFVYGLFEKDVSAQKSREFPRLYAAGQRSEYFSTREMMRWVIDAVYASVIMYFLMFYYFEPCTPLRSGLTLGVWDMGTTIYTTCVIAVTLRLAVEVNYWTVFIHISLWGSIVVFFAFDYLYSAMPPGMFGSWSTWDAMYWVQMILSRIAIYWITVFLVAVIVVIPGYAYRSWNILFYPKLVDLVRGNAIVVDAKLDPVIVSSPVKTPSSGSPDVPLVSLSSLDSAHDKLSRATSKLKAVMAISKNQHKWTPSGYCDQSAELPVTPSQVMNGSVSLTRSLDGSSDATGRGLSVHHQLPTLDERFIVGMTPANTEFGIVDNGCWQVNPIPDSHCEMEVCGKDCCSSSDSCSSSVDIESNPSLNVQAEKSNDTIILDPRSVPELVIVPRHAVELNPSVSRRSESGRARHDKNVALD